MFVVRTTVRVASTQTVEVRGGGGEWFRQNRAFATTFGGLYT